MEWAKAHFFVALEGFEMPAVERSGLLKKINELGERAAEGTGIEIADIQLKGAGKSRLLRVYIDAPGGVTLGHCETISERLGKLLDEDDPIPDSGYTLEVSSLGAERALSKPRDFERVVGQKVALTLNEAVNGQMRVEGTLVSFTDETLQLEAAGGGRMEIPLSRVQKAKLKLDW